MDIYYLYLSEYNFTIFTNSDIDQIMLQFVLVHKNYHKYIRTRMLKRSLMWVIVIWFDLRYFPNLQEHELISICIVIWAQSNFLLRFLILLVSKFSHCCWKTVFIWLLTPCIQPLQKICHRGSTPGVDKKTNSGNIFQHHTQWFDELFVKLLKEEAVGSQN